MTLEFLTLEEVADVLKISKQTVLRYIDAGELKALKLKREIRVSREHLQAFIDSRTDMGTGQGVVGEAGTGK